MTYFEGLNDTITTWGLEELRSHEQTRGVKKPSNDKLRSINKKGGQ